MNCYKITSGILHQMIVLLLKKHNIPFTKPKMRVLNIKWDMWDLPLDLKEIFWGSRYQRFIREMRPGWNK